MKQIKLSLIALLGLVLVVAGCSKKSADQASLKGTGFEMATTEDLAQLPQANSNTSSNQQAGIEVLPIETSPVTQGVLAPGPATMSSADIKSVATSTAVPDTEASTSTETLNHEQQIQTALKNAGFYTGKIDGKIGPGSKRAIEAFQTSKGLKVDGKVGPKTWAALEPYLNGDASSSSSTGAGTAATASATTD